MVGGVAIPGGVAVARLEQAVKVLFVENHPLCRAGASVLGSFGPFACAGACPASTTGGGQACGSPRSLCKRRAPQAPALRGISLFNLRSGGTSPKSYVGRRPWVLRQDATVSWPRYRRAHRAGDRREVSAMKTSPPQRLKRLPHSTFLVPGSLFLVEKPISPGRIHR